MTFASTLLVPSDLMQKRWTAFVFLVIANVFRLGVSRETSGGSIERLVAHGASDANSASSASTGAATTSEADLRSQLAAVDRDRRQLRLRLHQASHVVHEEIHTLGESVEEAKTAALRSEGKLRLQLNTVVAELKKTRAKEATERARAADAERELAVQAKSLEEANANASSIADASRATAQVTRKERFSLLEQISELKEEAQQFHHLEIQANQQMARIKKQADDERIAEAGEIQRLSTEQQQKVSMLQSEADAARAKATVAFRDSDGLQREADALRHALSKQHGELAAVEAERDELRAAQEASTRAETALRANLSEAQDCSKQERQNTDVLQQQYEEAMRRAAAGAKAASELQEKQKSVEAELENMNSTLARQTASSQEQLHQTMLAAAARVHALEDDRESVETESQKQTKALAEASANEETLQNDLQRETDEAIEASRNATEARAELASLAQSRQQALEKVAALDPKVKQLQSERDRLAADVKARAAELSQLQAKQEHSAKVAHDAQNKVQALEKDDQDLKDKVASLIGESQRADDLAVQVDSLRKAAEDHAKREAAVKSEMDRLRDLKESYSQQSENAQNESSALRARVDDLDAKFEAAKKELYHVTQQRTDALEAAKEARTQEDEYFDENVRLQQQAEALTAKLGQASEASNHSAEVLQALKAEVENTKAESARQQSNTQAAWLVNQKELMQIRRELAETQDREDSLKADRNRIQQVLTVAQRQKLGLPTPQDAAAIEKPATARRAGLAPKKGRVHAAVASQTNKLKLKVNASSRAKHPVEATMVVKRATGGIAP